MDKNTYLSQLLVTYVPAPPDESWNRFGRLPSPSYLWAKSTQNKEEALTVVTIQESPESKNDLKVLDTELTRGKGGKTAYIAYSNDPKAGTPILLLKVVKKDEALGEGFVLCSENEVSPDLFLAYQSEGSLASMLATDFEINVGDFLDCKDKVSKWCVCKVLKKESERIYVHYEGWSDKWNEWIDIDYTRVAKYRTYTSGNTGANTEDAAFTLEGEKLEKFKGDIEKLQTTDEIDWKNEEAVTFFTKTAPKNVADLLSAIINDANVVLPLVAKYLISYATFIGKWTAKTQETIPISNWIGLVHLFDADENNKRFYLRYGVSANEIDKPGKFATKVLRNVEYGQNEDSVYLSRCINAFGEAGGFDGLISRISDPKVSQNFSFKHVCYSLLLVRSASSSFVSSFKKKYIAQLAESAFSRVDTLSDDDIKSVSRRNIVSFVRNLDFLMQSAKFTKKKRAKRLEYVQLEVAYRLLTSPFLEKRIFGLSQICEFIDSINGHGNNGLEGLSAKSMVKWIQDKQLLTALLGQHVHQEVMKRTPEILKFLSFNNALTKDNLLTLWNASIDQHETVVRTVYSTIASLSKKLEIDDLDFLYDHIKKLPPENYSQYTLEFITSFTYSGIKRAAASKSVERWYGLSIFWSLIQDDLKVNKELKDSSFKALLHALQSPLCSSVSDLYLQKCVENVNKNNSVPISLKLLSGIINAKADGDDKVLANLISSLDSKFKIIKMLLQNISADVTDELDMKARLNFLELLLLKSSINLSIDLFKSLWSSYSKQPFFLQWLTMLQDKSAGLTKNKNNAAFKTATSQKIFEAYLCSDDQKADKVNEYTVDYFKLFQMFFMSINRQAGNLLKVNKNNNVHQVITFKNLKGMKKLWDIAIYTNDSECFEEASKYLVNLYFDLPPKQERFEIWVNFIDSAFKLLNNKNSLNLLKTFLDRLKNEQNLSSTLPKSNNENRNDNYYGRSYNKITINISVVNESNLTKVVNTIDASRLDNKKTFGFLRKELARVLKTKQNLLRIVHKSSNIVLWSGVFDKVSFKDSELEDCDDITVIQLNKKNPDPALPQYIVNKEPEKLRFRLSNDEKYFNQLFDLLKKGGNLAQMVWNLLETLPVNTKVAESLQNLVQNKNKNLDWDKIIDGNGILKLLYSLQIISEILTLEVKKQDKNKEGRSNDGNQDDGKNAEEGKDNQNLFDKYNITDKQRKWCDVFVNKGGLNYLYETLKSFTIEEFFSDSLPTQCFSSLIQLLYRFIAGNLSFVNKGKDEKGTLGGIDYNVLIPRLMDSLLKAMEVAKKPKIVVKDENVDSKEDMKMDVVTAQGQERKQEDEKNNKKEEEEPKESYKIIIEIMNLLTSCVMNTKANKDYKSLLDKCENLGEYLLNCKSPMTRHCVSVGLLNLVKKCDSIELNTGLCSKLLKFVTKIPTKCDSAEDMCSLINELLAPSSSKSYKLEDVQKSLTSSLFSMPKDIIRMLCDRVKAHPILEIRSQDHDEVITGLLEVLGALLRTFPQYKKDLINNDKFGQYILHSCLLDIPDTNTNLENAPPPPKCKSKRARKAAYALVVELIKDNWDEVGNICNLLETSNHMQSHSNGNNPRDFKFHPSIDEKSEAGYVGIRNLGCVCYMNSLLQQLFMIPQVRSNILSVPIDYTKQLEEAAAKAVVAQDKKGKKVVTVEDLRKEDFLYQLQYIFAYLQESEKMFANPAGFCYSFKDWDGSPTNVMVQKDTNEFLNMLFDRIDTRVEKTPFSRILKSQLGGVYSNELLGKDPKVCKHRRERYEPFYCMTLEVKNKRTINEALKSFVEGESLVGDNAFNCDKCQKKVDTIKRVVIKDLPPTMILHLKRFELNFDTMQMVKLNDRCEFPDIIDMKPYTREGLRDASPTQGGDEDQQEDKKNDDDGIEEIVVRPDYYYKYKLTGILIHTGSAHGGHYYSFIKERPDTKDPTKGKLWNEYNDHLVRPFDSSKIEEEAFGGEETRYSRYTGSKHVSQRYRNAYLLFYSRIPDPSKVEPENAAAEKVVERPKLVRKGSLVNKSEVPKQVFEKIWEENRAFWHDKYVFDTGYFRFLKMMVSSSLKELNIAKLLDEKDQSEIEEKKDKGVLVQRDEVEGDKRADCLFSIGKLSIRFVITTISRSMYKDYLWQWVVWCKQLLRVSNKLCKWLCEQLAISENSRWIKELLLMCPEFEVRKSMGSIIGIAFQAMANAEPDLVIKALESSFLPWLKKCSPYWTQYNQYWRCISIATSANSQIAQYLNKKEVLTSMVHSLLLEASPLSKEHPLWFKTPTDALDKKIEIKKSWIASPDVTCFFTLLRDLVMIGGYSENDKMMLTSSQFLSKCFSLCDTRSRGSDMSTVTNKLCEENKAMSESCIVQIIEGIEVSDTGDIRSYFRIISPLLKLKDKLQQWRIDTCMSSFLAIIKMNRKYWNATIMCIEHLLRLNCSEPEILEWTVKNSNRVSWVIEWLNMNGNGPGQEGMKMEKPKQNRSQREEYYRFANDNNNKVGRNGYGLSAKEKKKLLRMIVAGKYEIGANGPERWAIEDSDVDESDRVFRVGEKYDVIDKVDNWCVASIKIVAETKVKVHYEGWSSRYDEWIETGSNRITPLGSHTGKKQKKS